MLINRIKTGFLILAVSVLIPLSCFALTLEEAKAKGILGERPNGYLGVVISSPAANQLAQDINAQRREMYKSIAAKNGTPLTTVESLAGRKAIESTPRGGYVQDGKNWVKK